MSRRRYQNVPWGVFIATGAFVVVVAAVFAVRSRVTASADPVAMADPAATAAPVGSASLDSLLGGGTGPQHEAAAGGVRDQILAKAQLPDAIAAARPYMENTIGRVDGGSALLALWASRHLTWAALEGLNETSPALFRKDPEAERGKRLCMSGTVREIRAEKNLAGRTVDDRASPLIVKPVTPSSAGSDSPSAGAQGTPSVAVVDSDLTIPDDGKVFIATIESKLDDAAESRAARRSSSTAQSLVVEIIAVRSSGTLVDGSDARVCGVLTGVNLSTASASDQTQHRIVGMFDLPANRTAAPSTTEVAAH